MSAVAALTVAAPCSTGASASSASAAALYMKVTKPADTGAAAGACGGLAEGASGGWVEAVSRAAAAAGVVGAGARCSTPGPIAGRPISHSGSTATVGGWIPVTAHRCPASQPPLPPPAAPTTRACDAAAWAGRRSPAEWPTPP
eukprot:scaffold17453_cov101-Isochrysis_galbana.AAC.1